MLHSFSDPFDCAYLIVYGEDSTEVPRSRSPFGTIMALEFFLLSLLQGQVSNQVSACTAAAEIPPMEAKDRGVICERWVCAAGAVRGHGDLWA